MSETSEHEADPPSEDEGNPTDEELDVEGPNESAPGHHPDEDDLRKPPTRRRPPSRAGLPSAPPDPR